MVSARGGFAAIAMLMVSGVSLVLVMAAAAEAVVAKVAVEPLVVGVAKSAVVAMRCVCVSSRRRSRHNQYQVGIRLMPIPDAHHRNSHRRPSLPSRCKRCCTYSPAVLLAASGSWAYPVAGW